MKWNVIPGGLAGTPAILYGTTYGAGVATTFVRTDATLKYPASLMSPTNSFLLTISDDGTDTFLTAPSGILTFSPTSEMVAFPFWAGAGGFNPIVGTILNFSARTATVGDVLLNGINAILTYDSATAVYSGASHRVGEFQLAQGSSATSYTNETAQTLRLRYSGGTSLGVGPNTFTEVGALNLICLPPFGSGTTVTDSYGIRQLGWPTFGASGTHTNCYDARFMFPTIGTVIRRGVWVDPSSTINQGTEADDTEAFYSGALPRGLINRRNYAALGATTGTPTTAVILEQLTAHAVGTNRRFLKGLNASVLSNPSGVGDTVLSLSQLNTGATAGAHINYDSKAGDPPSPVSGDFWRNARNLRFYEGTLTHNLTPMTTRGDIVRMGAATEERLAAGADTSFLMIDPFGTPNPDPEWATINDLVADGTPDAAADYVMTWDASLGTHRKVLLNLIAAGAGGDNITVNGSGVVNADFDDATPAASVWYVNGVWQKDGGSPANISVAVPEGGIWHTFTQSFGTSRRSGFFDVTTSTGLLVGDTIDMLVSTVPIATKGQCTDEFEMDPIFFVCRVLDATHFRAYWWSPSVIVGDYNLSYQRGL